MEKMSREFKPTHILKMFVLVLVCEVSCGQRVQVNVGVVVMDEVALAGKRVLTTLDIALSDFYSTHSSFKTRLSLHRRSSGGDVVTSASVVVDLIKNVKASAIIGPETSMEAHFDISLGDKSHVPIITYSATSPFLARLESDYFIQATQVDVAQVQAITSIIQAFGWRQVVPIYVDNEFGGGLIPTFVDSLQQIGTRIPYRSKIPSSASNDQIDAELNNLKSMPTRVLIVHMGPILGVNLFSRALKLGMMSGDYVWIISNGICNLLDILMPDDIQAMQGVVGVRTYFPPTKELDDFKSRWKAKLKQENSSVSDPQITVFELWAYDAITALAKAVEQVVGIGFGFDKTNVSSNGSISTMDLSTLGVSRAGKDLIPAIRDTSFIGLSGNFTLVDHGQLNSSILEIVNIFGTGKKNVGVWTPGNGFLREMNFSDDSGYSISKERLGSIIWPGDNKDPPKGWVTPINGNKLRVLVPIKNGFEQFVKVEKVNGSEPKITGFCFEVFEEVMKSLPYPVLYEYIPFDKPDGAPTDSYNELISEIYYKRYDAVMGDVSILANRSRYVDFTFPYTESGVIMVAPIEDNNRRMDWVFFKPLSVGLWMLAILSFAIFGLTIWALERKTPGLQTHTESMYFSCSTLVFAHGNHVRSNYTRCLMVPWLFFVFILTQSYTANLASMLTVNQLQPRVTDIDQLVKTGVNVGYQDGSFVHELLLTNKIKNSSLVKYGSVEELHDLFENGTIAAAFDEIPYMKIFLANSDNCQKYMMVHPIYNTDGLGFVFPLGSPLGSDVSRQVLQVREGKVMVSIEEKWFSNLESCPESSTASIISSSSLRFNPYIPLFLIMLFITVVILVMSIITSRCAPQNETTENENTSEVEAEHVHVTVSN